MNEIQRYATPTILIEVDPAEVQDIWFTIADGSKRELLTKKRAEMEEAAEGFKVKLSQEDTASLPEGDMRLCYLQARVLFQDGSSVATEIEKRTVGQILKEGVMT